MSTFADIQIKKYTGILNVKIKAEELRFGIPSKFKAIKLAAMSVLTPITNDLKKTLSSTLQNLSSTDFLVDTALAALQGSLNITDDDIFSYIKTNSSLQLLTDWAALSYYTNSADEISIICNDQDLLNSNILADLSDADVESFTSLLSKDSELPTTTPDKHFSDGQHYPWLFLIYWLIINIKNWITSTRYPSPNRRKYLQSLIRNIGSQLKAQLAISKETISTEINKTTDSIKDKEHRIKENLQREGTSIKHAGSEIKKTTTKNLLQYKDQLKKLIKTLATLDNILIGIGATTLVYLENRSLEQSKSEKELSQLSLSNTCSDIDSTTDSSIISKPFSTDNFSCPITNNIIVPHQPLTDKINSLECSTSTQESKDITPKIKQNLSTLAVIENLSKINNFNINVTVGSTVYPETLLGSIGHSLIYSPVSGTVSNITPNKVSLSDTSDINQNLLESTAITLNNSYEEISNIKEFIKSFFIISQLPILLDNSPAIDSSGNFKANLSTNKHISDLYQKELKSNTNLLDSFNKNIESITNQDNIKIKAENNQLLDIKSDLDTQENSLFSNLSTLAKSYINKANITYTSKQDFILINYYLNLLSNLYSLDSNEIVTSFTKHINTIITERIFADNYDETLLIKKINELAVTLNESYFFELPDFYQNIDDFYINYNNKSKTKNYISSIGIDSKLSKREKESLTNQIYDLFFITKDVESTRLKETSTKNSFQLTVSESLLLSEFFAQLYKKLKDFPTNSARILKKLEDLVESGVPPSTRVTDSGREYEWYGVKADPPSCQIPVEGDSYLSAATEFTYSDIEYWIKYCTFATLASVVNPLSGWSTGIPAPIGPIQLPVVYIPIKSFETKWGIVLMGLTVCGLYVFPMMMYVNASSEYNTPFPDPRDIVKIEIGEMKKSISEEREELREGVMKRYLKRIEIEVNEKNREVERIEGEKREHRLRKPIKPRYGYEVGKVEKVKGLVEYRKEMLLWREDQVVYVERIGVVKSERYISEKKYDIVRRIFEGREVEEGEEIGDEVKSMVGSVDRIEGRVDVLSKRVEELDSMLIPLPISMKPDSVNFGITIKSPKIMNEIADDLDDNIDEGVLGRVIEESEVKSNDYMDSGFGESLEGYGEMRDRLEGSMSVIVKGDMFPKYENMSVRNIVWNKYLISEFVVKGARVYGMPGFPPVDI